MSEADSSAADPIAACVVCRNEGDRLGDCLASVAWADEVLVLDLESSDDSAEVARRHGARVIPHEPVVIVELVRNELAAQANADWILVLDPDERVTPSLAAELQALRGRDDVDAVWMPRRNVDFGHAPEAPEHGLEPQLRMYRRSRVAWPTQPNKLPVVPEERVHRVPARDELVLVHLRNRTVAEAIERVLRYAPATAEARIAAGQTFTARDMIRSLANKSQRHYLRSNAFDEGVPGVVRATVLVVFHFYVWAAFWQMSGAKRTSEDDAAVRRLGRAIRIAALAVRAAGAPGRLRARLARRSP